MLYGTLLLYITLIYIRPAEIVPQWATIPFVDILTVIAALIAALSLAFRPRPFLNLPHDKLILAFWGVIAISSFKVWLTGVWYAWLAFTPAIVCYFLIRLAVRSERQLRGVMYLLIALNVFLAVNGIVQYHTGIGLGNVQMKLDRIYGTGIFNDPNDLGMTFVMAVPLVVLLIGRSKILGRVFGVVCLGVILVAIYYTNSRGALVGFGATIVCYSFLKFRTVAGTLIAATLLGLIVVAAPSRGSEMDAADDSAQSRIQSWAEGLVMLKSHPLTGVGYDQYTEYNPKVAHNSFVHTFAELGLLGAVCFVGMFYWYFKGLSTIPPGTGIGELRKALLASAVGMLTCGWFLSRQYVPIFYVLLALGACATAIEVPKHSEALRTNLKDVIAIATLTFIGIAAVYLSTRTLAIWSGGYR